MAEQHITASHPDFEQAKQRMTDAYAKLFELEQKLRTFVESILESKYPGTWWDIKVRTDIRQKVSKREKESPKYFDDYSPSRLRFADLDDLRDIIVRNHADFANAITDIEWFNATMMYLVRPRDRIAHANTLTFDEAKDFLSSAGRLVRTVEPHIQLK